MSAEKLPTTSSGGEPASDPNAVTMTDPYMEIAMNAISDSLDSLTLDEICRTNLNTKVLREFRMPVRNAEIDSIPDTIRKLHSELYPAEVTKYSTDNFNVGILAIGIDNFLSAAAQFCQDEARYDNATIVVSVGSHDGTIERAIIRAHHQRFGKDIDIVLIDPDPRFTHLVNYQTVDVFVNAFPTIVGHCIALIIWPRYFNRSFDNYDIQVLRKLQPFAALTIYEMSGVFCNTGGWSAFLYDDSLDDLSPEETGVLNYECKTAFSERDHYGLDNYTIEELVHQRIRVGPLMGTTAIRLVKLKRTGDPRPYTDTIAASEEAAVQKITNDYFDVDLVREEHEQLVVKEQSLKTGGETENSDDLRLVLAKLGIYDRHLDYDFLVQYAKVDYSTLNPTNDIDHAKIMLNAHLSFTELPDFREEVKKLHPSQNKKHDLHKYKDGVIGLGVDNFLSAAVQFCRNEARRGTIEIISVGSGDGSTEKCIVGAYRQRFGKEIRIKLIDSDPIFKSRANFESVNDLIAKRPYVVGHCVLFLLWPNRAGLNNGEDIDAIRTLQPHSVLIVYENTGRSGSHSLREFLHDNSLDLSPSSEEFGLQNYLDQSCRMQEKDFGLQNYSIVEIARQKVPLRPISGTFTIRMVKLKRT